MENNLQEIREFTIQWRERAIRFYSKELEEYSKAHKDLWKKYYGDACCGSGNPEYSKEYRELVRSEEYTSFTKENYAYYSLKDATDRIVKRMTKEAETKEKQLVARVNKVVGTIVKAIELYVGVNGELNGYIQGENGTCKIETIYAGGYNIQCLHYRVLVKLVK